MKNLFSYFPIFCLVKVSHSVLSDSLWSHGLYSPWNSPGLNIGVGSSCFLQGIFPTQGSKPGLPHYRQILYQLSHKESPLKDKAPGKGLICRQAGHWDKECPNHGKSPKMVCYKCHQLRHWVAFCPGDPRASRSRAKPSLMMVQQD